MFNEVQVKQFLDPYSVVSVVWSFSQHRICICNKWTTRLMMQAKYQGRHLKDTCAPLGYTFPVLLLITVVLST